MSNSTWLDTYSTTVDKLLFKIEQVKMKGTFHESLIPEFKGPYFKVISNDDENKVHALMFGGNSSNSSNCDCISVRDGGFGEEILGLSGENSSNIKNLQQILFCK
jgi:hypothetical protein